MALTKNEIIDRIVKLNEGDSRRKSANVLDMLLEIIKKSLENGEDVLVSNFGKFQIVKKAERKGRNPATGDNMMLPERRIVTFKTSSTLRVKMKNGKNKR